MASQFYSESMWKKLVEEYFAGEKSGTEFCKEKGLNKSTFHKWKARFSNRDQIQLKQSDFIELKPGDTKVNQPIELCFPGAIKLCWNVESFKVLKQQLQDLSLL